MKNLLLLALLVLSISACDSNYGVTNPQQKYEKVVKSDSGEGTFYVALTGQGAPTDIVAGWILAQSLYVQNISVDGMSAGKTVESLYLIDCDKHKYIAVIDSTRNPDFSISYAFSENVIQNQAQAAELLLLKPWSKIKPGTAREAVTNTACEHIKGH